MFDVIDDIVAGKWFKQPSPFRCVVEKGHPKLCVITGPNTSGKSLLRKVIHNRYADRKMEYMAVSQEQRCASHGIQRLLIYGTETDESTGYNSVKMLLKAFQTGQSREKPFAIMLDEPEIGCSDETQAGIGLRIAREIDTMPNLHGMFVVTHSRQLVKNLIQTIQPTHWRLGEDGLNLEQWLNRDVVATDLDALLSDGKEKWHAVHKMIGL
jgi:hypothetical protein